MCFTWHGAARTDSVVHLGALALLVPLLERLQVAELIDRHLPADPQQEFSHGQVLSLLLAARLSQPTALVNVPAWAEQSGADIFWDIPPAKLNDDRLGRALDAFFTQRHAILASVAAQTLHLADLTTERLHFDTTHLTFTGAYATAQPRPAALPLPPATPSADFPPAQPTYGHGAEDVKLVQVGVCAVVDELGAVPVYSHVLDGNANGHTGIAETFELLRHHLPPPSKLLLVSDRGTFSAGHVARVQEHGYAVLCSVPWPAYQALFDQHRAQLRWQRASYQSVEQQRRRETDSSLPLEHYDRAVVRHQLVNPNTQAEIPCRVLFVFSTADQKVCQQTRTKACAQIQAGLEQLATTIQRGHPATTRASSERRVAKLLGRKAAARYFQWELVPLSAAEQAALPPPGRGCRRPTLRLVFR